MPRKVGFKTKFKLRTKKKVTTKVKAQSTPAQIIDNYLKSKVPSESVEQKTLIKWWELYSKVSNIPTKLLFHIPNGGKRSVTEATSFVAEGVRAGIPDLMLAIPQKSYHGLFIEMKKRKGGVLSELQKEMLITMREQGYAAYMCNGFEVAKHLIETYLAQKSLNDNDLSWEKCLKC